MPLDFEVITYWTDHEEFSSICANEYLGLIKPCMSSEVASLRQFLHLLVSLERIILNLE